MLALNSVAIGFLTPLTNLVQIGIQLQILRSYLDRIEDVMNTAPESGPEASEATRLEHLDGTVSLRGVSFQYLPGATPAIRDLTLEVPQGCMLAIVGASGSGKSTLASLLAGLVLPTTGEITFDGKPPAQLAIQSLRSNIGYVPQRASLFTGTIRDNISFHDATIPMARISAAARQARIHEEIMALPLAYETPIAAGGASLSGGQCQRLAIARALVQNPRMVILDEATNALDQEMEGKILEHLQSLACTRVVVTHRLASIRKADLIVVLDKGQLAEIGTHRDLDQQGSLYRRLASPSSP
jgi:ABC-type bacteriocin/lantibiotic exporter with double-glycine peptidase domain